MKITENKQSRFRHYVRAPKRFLRRARDFYIDSLVTFDSKVGSATIITCPAPNTTHMPKNFGSNKLRDEDEKLEETHRQNWSNMDFDRVVCLRERGSSGYGGIERSYSVALGKIGTIDEDEQCEFQENLALKNDMFLRTRSHAVSRNYGFH